VGAGGGVLGEAEGEVGGVGGGHADNVGVEDSAGEVVGGGAGEGLGDEGAGDALGAVVG